MKYICTVFIPFDEPPKHLHVNLRNVMCTLAIPTRSNRKTKEKLKKKNSQRFSNKKTRSRIFLFLCMKICHFGLFTLHIFLLFGLFVQIRNIFVDITDVCIWYTSISDFEFVIYSVINDYFGICLKIVCALIQF